MEWTKIDDKLPPEEKQVLLNTGLGVTVGSLEIKHDGPCYRIGNDALVWDYDYNLGGPEIIGWMPLPKT